MIKYIFVLLCAVTLSVSTYGQNMDADLRKSFNKFSVVKINDKEALEKAKLKIPFQIQTDEKNFQFILRLNDIRSKDYKAEYTDKNGRHSLPKGEIFTYKTTLIGERNSIVALTVDGTKTEGYLATQYEGFFIESAKKYSSHAKDEDKVIYKVKDKVNKDDGICGLDEAVASEMKRVGSDADFTASSSPIGKRVLEVATEADKEFVLESITGNGSPATANAHILSVLNQVDAVYERQLSLSIEVTFQHAWMPGTADPYAGKIDDALLYAFRDYWNDNFPASNPSYQRDVGHMFTAKNDSYAGAATGGGGTICRYPLNAYSYTSSLAFNKWVITAHELGHNFNADHYDEINPVPPDCAGTATIMRSFVAFGATEFCPFSVNQITSFVNTYGSCLQFESDPERRRTLFDFDADEEADISVFRPSNAFWYIQQSTAGFYSTPFGLSTDKLAPADYDNDGKTDIAVFRDGTWYLQRSKDGSLIVGFGVSGDIPVPADFTGDRKSELALFRPSTGVWYTLDLTNNQTITVQLGQSGDKPVIGDFDGDGRADYAVFRPQNATWYLLQSTQGARTVQFGNSTDKSVPADYTGDGKTDLAVFRPSSAEWFILRSEDNSFYSLPFGVSSDIPAPADYDGDGKADVAVFRNGTWIRTNSSNNVTVYISFGLSGDIPIPSFNIVQ